MIYAMNKDYYDDNGDFNYYNVLYKPIKNIYK